jgi:parallel beta-helix repeat protein
MQARPCDRSVRRGCLVILVLVPSLLAWPGAMGAIAAAPKGSCPAGRYETSYYGNVRLAGPPKLIRCENSIDRNWGRGRPAPSLPRNNFSARWQATLTLDAGVYDLLGVADDGFRVFVDGAEAIDAWDGKQSSAGVRLTLTGGIHEVVVEYMERTRRAKVGVSLERVPETPTQSATPCEGIDVVPGTNLRALVEAEAPGTTFCLRAGIHRVFTPIFPKAGQKFIGEPGTIVSGARVLDNWVQEGSHYYVDGQTEQSEPYGECTEGTGSACRYNEDVYFDDTRLDRVLSLGELGSGKFFFDYDADRIYIGDDPNGHTVEVAVGPQFMDGYNTSGGNVVRNLIVEKFATRASVSAIQGGDGWVIENNEFRFNHGIGVGLHGTDSVLRNNFIHHNGQLGMGGYKTVGSLVEGNEVSFNNTAGFDRGWEAGASKFVYAANLTVRGNFVHDNYGNGLWTDGDAINVVYEDNIAVRQEGNGIHHEISCDAVIRNNTFSDNGGGGIVVTASQNVVVKRNVVENNGQGIVLWHQDRERDPNDPHECAWILKDVRVRHNSVTMGQGYTGALVCCGVENPEAVYAGDRLEFVGNSYHLGSLQQPFHWLGSLVTVDEWIGYGNDVDGEFLE